MSEVERRSALEELGQSLTLAVYGSPNADLLLTSAWTDEVCRRCFVDAAAERRSTAIRRLGTLCLNALAEAPENQARMWNDAATRDTLVASAAAAAVNDGLTRQLAIETLATLALRADVAAMWGNARCRGVLVAAAHTREPMGVRFAALEGLCELATSAANRRAMWTDERCRESLVVGAAVDKPEIMRTRALEALCELAADEGNRGTMWLHCGEVMVDAVQAEGTSPKAKAEVQPKAPAVGDCGGCHRGDPSLQTLGLEALVLLAQRRENRRPMWCHAGCRKCILAVAATKAAEQHGGGLSHRALALEALSLLARDEPRNCIEMWRNRTCRRCLLEVAGAAEPKEEPARLHAINTLIFLAKNPATAEAVVSDADCQTILRAAAMVAKAPVRRWPCRGCKAERGRKDGYWMPRCLRDARQQGPRHGGIIACSVGWPVAGGFFALALTLAFHAFHASCNLL